MAFAFLIEGCGARRRHREALWVGTISEGGWCASSAHLLVAKTWLIKRERLCQSSTAKFHGSKAIQAIQRTDTQHPKAIQRTDTQHLKAIQRTE